MSSKEYFDNVANQWDTMREVFFSERVRETALSTIQTTVKAGQVAADIGAGSGFITEALLKANYNVIAVDQSEEMLKTMKKKFGQRQVDYRVGNSENLPIEDNSVDYALANMYLHHVEDPALAVHEMTRILKPDGWLVITDLDTHKHTFLIDEHHDRWMGFERDVVMEWFKKAGLISTKIADIGCECSASSACGTHEASISIFIASGLKG
ncbi:MAG: class I SAM-dependent methyltransferase [Chloroflexota bacterium]